MTRVGVGARPRWIAGFLLVLSPSGFALADTLAVPADFETIQAAIDDAEPDDVVLVEPGTYTENLTLRTGVDVIGRETARTILAPDDDTLPTVTFNGVTGARLSNFTLIDSGVGVSVRLSSGIDVLNVVFDRASEAGLAVDDSSTEAVNNVFYRNNVAISRGNNEVEIVNSIFAENGTAIATGVPLLDPFENARANCFFDNADSPIDGDATGGAGATFGDPAFVDPDRGDFHLREGSACIDVGRGLDVIDSTAADAGAYGGEAADRFPFPVPRPTLDEVQAEEPGLAGIAVSWQANLSYRVTSSTSPGGYRVYYKRGSPPADDVPSAYDGTGAAGGPSPIDVGSATEYTLEGLAAEADPPLAPRLTAADGRNESAILRWDAAAGATGYRVHYGVGDVAENREEVGDVTSYAVTGLTNGETYRFAVTALNQASYHVAVSVVDNTQARNESALSPPSSLAVGSPAESELSQVLSATPVLIDAYPELPDEDVCFIATAAFESKSATEVEVLRAFRDRFLSTHRAGRWAVARYYAMSPPAARFLNEHEALKPLVRAMLMPLVLLALVLLEGGEAGVLLAVAMAAGVTAIVQRRRRLRRPARRRKRGAVAGSLAAVLALAAGGNVSGQEAPATSSPRWMYEIKGGYFYPELDEYETFYGDDRDTAFAVSGAYRLRDWLEVGGEIGYMRDRGEGRTADGQAVPDAVKQELLPLRVFANFILEHPDRRFVPYAGIGLGWVLYRQEVELQPSRDGRTDTGAFARAGVRWRFASSGDRSAASRGRDVMFTRSYVFVEAQRFTAEIDDVDLGGTAYLLGVRFEFELGQ